MILHFTNVHNLQQACVGGWVVDKFMKFPFYKANIYRVTNFQMNLWVNFHPLHTAKVNRGNIKWTNSSQIWVRCLWMIFYVCNAIGFVDRLDRGYTYICIYDSVPKGVMHFS